jgi:hypothetical protein
VVQNFRARAVAGSLPEDNLATVALARKLASEIHRVATPQGGTAREAWAKSQREELKSVIRYNPVSATGAWKSFCGSVQ